MRKLFILVIGLVLLTVIAGQTWAATLETGITQALSSSNTAAINPVEYLADNKLDTAWWTTETTPGSAWVELRLATTVRIAGLKFYGAYQGEMAVEYWQDGWHQFLAACSLKGNEFYSGWNLIDLSFDRIATGRLRLVFANPGQYAKLGGIGEIKVIGEAAATLERLDPATITTNRRVESEHPVEYLFDHNTNTSWWLKPGAPSPAEVIADLGEVCNIKRIKLFSSNDTTDKFKEHNVFKIQYLQNNSWLDIPGMVNLDVTQIGASWRGYDLEGMNIVTGKIRVLMDGRQRIGGLKEIEVWGNHNSLVDSGHACSRYIFTNCNPVSLSGNQPANYSFSIKTPVNDFVNLHLTAKGNPAAPLIWELNGKAMGTLTPTSANHGFIIYSKQVPAENLWDGANFIRVYGDNIALYDCRLEITPDYRLNQITSGGLTDRWLLTSASNGEEVIDFGGTRDIDELVLKYLGNFPGVQIAVDRDGQWSGFTSSYRAATGAVDGEMIYKGIGLARRIKVNFPPLAGGLTEVTVNSSPVNDGPPLVRILAPLDGDCLSLAEWSKQTLRGTVDNPDVILTVNGRWVDLNGTFFEIPLTELDLKENEEKTIEAVAVDTKGRAGSDRITIMVGRPPEFTVNLPDTITYTRESQITVKGKVVAGASYVMINGAVTPVVNGVFNTSINLREGLNQIIIKVSQNDKFKMVNTKVRYVVRNSAPPYLKVLYPVNGQILSDNQLIMSGETNNLNQVSITVNGQKIAVNNGSFNSPPISLTEGENKLIVVATDQSGLTNQVELKVYLDTIRPELNIVNPAESSYLKSTVVSVSGTVKDASPVSVLVNGEAALITGNSFSIGISLNEGWNDIQILAKDAAGNQKNITRKVYIDTKPPAAFTPTVEPSGWTNNNHPVFTFTTTDAESGIDHYEIRFDGGIWSGSPVNSPYQFTEAIPDGEHTVEIKAIDKAGWGTVSAPVAVKIDTVPPDAPGVVRVVPGDGKVELFWKLITAPLTGEGSTELAPPDPPMLKYLIQRDPQFNGNAVLELGDVKEYVDPGLQNGVTYKYRIAAVDLASNQGDWSEWQYVIVGIAVVNYDAEKGSAVEYDGIAIAVPAQELPDDKKIVMTTVECPSLLADNLNQTDPTVTPASLPTGAEMPVSPIYVINIKDTVTGEIEQGKDLPQTVIGKIAYDPAKIPGSFPEENLAVFWFDPVFSHWFQVPSVVDKENNEVLFCTNHFSSFMVQPTIVQDISPEEYREMGISPLKSYATQGPVNVSPMGGTMSTRAVDLALPGKDGKDLVFARTYDSATARSDSLGLDISATLNISLGNLSALNDFTEVWKKIVNNSLLGVVEKLIWAHLWCQGDAAFSTGQGWRLEFPYIKLMGAGAYLRMPNGSTYEIHNAKLVNQIAILDPSGLIAGRSIKLINEEGEYFTLSIDEFAINNQVLNLLNVDKNTRDTLQNFISGILPSWIPMNYKLVLKDGTTYYFDMFGRPTRKYDAAGDLELTFNYSGVELSSIVDSVGRTIQFEYSGLVAADIIFPRVTKIKVLNDNEYTREVNYEIDGCGLLQKATDPGGRFTEYHYYSDMLIGLDASVTINIAAVVTALVATPAAAALMEDIFGPSVSITGRLNIQFIFPMDEIRPQYGGATTIAYDKKMVSRITFDVKWLLFVPVSLTVSGNIEGRLFVSKVTVAGESGTPSLERNYVYQMKVFDVGSFLVDRTIVTDGVKQVEYHYITKKQKRYRWEDHSSETIGLGIPLLTLVTWGYEDVPLNDSIITKDQNTGETLETKLFEYDDEQDFLNDLIHWEDDDTQASMLLISEKTTRGASDNGKNERLITYAYDDYGNVTYMYDSGGVYKIDGTEYTADDHEVWTKYINSEQKHGTQPLLPVTLNSPYQLPVLGLQYRGLIAWKVERIHTPVGENGEEGTRVTQTFYDYNSYGKVTREDIWDGKSWHTTYYAYYGDTHLLQQVTAPGGQVTEYTYDSYGFPRNVVKKNVKDADGVTKDITASTGYDRMSGWKKWEKDGRGYVTEYQYDALGRVVATIYPDDNDDTTWNPVTVATSAARANNPGQTVSFDDTNLTSTIIDPRNGKVLYDYDPQGQLKRIVKYVKNGVDYQEYAVTSLSYDAYGHITQIVDPNGNITGAANAYKYTTKYQYDALGNVTRITYPDETEDWSDNPHKIFNYNSTAMTATVTDEEGRVTVQDTDMLGHVLKETKQMTPPVVTEAKYDGAGNKVWVKTPQTLTRNYITKLYFNSLNQLVKTEMPQDTFFEEGQEVNVSPVITYEYDLVGNRTAEIREQTGKTTVQEILYDGLGRPTTVNIYTNLDKTVKYSTTKTYYDENGNKTKVVDANNTPLMDAGKDYNYYSFTYTARNQLASETDPRGHIISYTYDANGNRTSLTDQRGNATDTANDYTVWYQYDDLNRVVLGILPDSTPPTSPFTDSGDNPVVKFAYDRRGSLLSKEIKPRNDTATVTYPGQLTAYTYYPRYWVKDETVSSAVNGDGANGKVTLTTTNTYDKAGNIKQVTDARGKTTTYEYDELNRKTAALFPEHSMESYQYDMAGNRTAVTDGNNYTANYVYNSQNKLISVTDPKTNTVAYNYDRFGNMTRMVRPEGDTSGETLTTDYTYDNLGRLTKIHDPLGFDTTYSYDPVGNRTYAKDPNGNESTYTYYQDNLLKQLLVLKDLDGKCIEYDYDEAHQQTNAKQYNAHLPYAGATTPVLTLESKLTKDYSVMGEVNNESRMAADLATNHTTNYTYDYLGNLKTMTYPGAYNPLQFNYNQAGQLTDIPGFINGSATTPGISYDGNLPNIIRYANGVTLTDTYDGKGRLSARTDSGPAGKLLDLGYNYDPSDNINRRTSGEQINTYFYDKLNQLTDAFIYTNEIDQMRNTDFQLGQAQKDYFGTKVSALSQEDFTLDLDYDATSLSVVFTKFTKDLQKVELYSDSQNHRISKKRQLAVYYRDDSGFKKLNPDDWTFAIDRFGAITLSFPKLVSAYELKIHCLFDDHDLDNTPVKRKGTKSEFSNLAYSMVKVYLVYHDRHENYDYDRNGNRTSETIGLLYPKTWDYNYYPDSDRLKTKISTTGDTNWAFVYDNNGNLLEKGNAFTNIGGEINFITSGDVVSYWQYQYDVLNRLVSVKKNGVRVASYIYDPTGLRIAKQGSESVLYDYDLAGNLIEETNLSNNTVKSYVWFAGKLLTRVDGWISGTGAKYFFENDQVGSPLVVTDITGKMVWRGDVTPFGNKIGSYGESFAFEDSLRFTGKDWDQDVGLYYFNARWMDPELGRFISEDPGNDPNSPNLYSYCANNPVVRIDRDGNFWQCVLEVLLEWAIGNSFIDPEASPGEFAKQAGVNLVTAGSGQLVRGTGILRSTARGALQGATFSTLNQLVNDGGVDLRTFFRDMSIGAGLGFVAGSLEKSFYAATKAAVAANKVTTEETLTMLATKVDVQVEGRGPVSGTFRHSLFKQEVDTIFGDNPLIKTETTYLAGQEVKYGTKGGVRVDVIEYNPDGSIKAVYDLKTGGAELTKERILEIRKALRVSDEVPVIAIKPVSSPATTSTATSAVAK